MPRVAELEQADLGKMLEERIRQQACEYGLLVDDVWKNFSHRPAAFRGLIKYELDLLISKGIVEAMQVRVPRRKENLHFVYLPEQGQEDALASQLVKKLPAYLLREFGTYNQHLPGGFIEKVRGLAKEK